MKNTNKTLLALATTTVAVAVAFGIFFGARSAPNAPAAPTAAETVAVEAPVASLHYVVGEHHSWRVEMDANSTTRLAINPDPQNTAENDVIAASFLLDARLHSQVVALMPDGGAHVRVWVDEVATLTFAVQGQESRAALAELLPAAAIDLHVDSCNRIVRIRTPESHSTGHQIVQSVVEAGWPAVCGEPTIDGAIATRTTTHGDARDTLVTTGSGNAYDVVHTERQYVALRLADVASTTQQVSAEGLTTVVDHQITSNTSYERLTVRNLADAILDAETRFAWSDVREHAATAFAANNADWRQPGTRGTSESTARQMLERRAGSLDGEALVSTLTTYANAGTVPDHNNFLWQAPARLTLEPELATTLRDLATADSATSAGRGLLLDLLSQTNTPESARATLETLQHENVRADRMYPILLQRISFVPDPPAAMVSYVTELATTATSFNERTAATYALGSLVAALDNNERTDEADETHATLTRTLASTDGSDQHVHTLRALANAERIADLPTFIDASRSSNSNIRIAAAAALGPIQTELTTDTLLTLASDAEARVQREAIAALRHHDLGRDALQSLATLAGSDRLDVNNAMPLLDLAKYYAGTHPEAVSAIANAVIGLPVNGTIRGAAHELLDRSTAP
jgi:hypothetical protein